MVTYTIPSSVTQSYTVSSGQSLEVQNGGESRGSVILGGGNEQIDAGGSSFQDKISGAEALQSVYGTATSTTVNGGYQGVVQGGTAIDAIIVDGGYQSIASGGTAIGGIDGAGGYQLVAGGATTTGTILSGGNSQVQSGGATKGTLVDSGAQIVDAGGTATGTIISGGAQAVSGLATGTIVNGGSQSVDFGGTATATAVNASGLEVVSAGGRTSDTVVSSGGILELIGSATETGTVVSSGGTLEAGSGHTEVGYTIGNGVTLAVLGAGTATVTTVDEGGIEVVSAGGVTSDTTVRSGGTLDLIGSAVETGTVVSSGGTLEVGSGYVESGFVVSDGVTLAVLSAGTATGTAIDTGGTLTVSSGGTATATTISGGTEVVDAGGMDLDAIILAGTQTVSGTATGATVSGGEQDVYGSATGTIVAGGTEVVEAGGMDRYAVVITGNQVVYGSATGTKISGGVQDLYGTTTGTTIDVGGDQSVESGGIAAGTTISGGQLDVQVGGMVTDTAIRAGTQNVYGTATGTAISGGTEFVQSGGTTANTVIAGGTLDLKQGAITSGSITFTAPGTLEVDAAVSAGTSVSFASPIDDLAAGDTIDLAGLGYTGAATSATVSGSSLVVTDGAATETFNIGARSAHYVSATADGHGGTLLTAVSAVAPTVAGLEASSTTSGTAAVMPFAGGTVTDLNDGGTDTDTLTVVQSGAGTLSSGGTTLSGTASGTTTTYVLSGTAQQLTADLRSLSFTPPGTPNTTVTTTFALTDTSPSYAGSATGSTSVVDTTAAVAPTIVGGGFTSTTGNAPVTPFTAASVGDPNANSTDTLSIQVQGGGTLSGTGLGGGTNGLYSLSGTAQQVTGELEALTFTPAANGPNTTTTTSFTLTDATTAGTSATNGATSVTDTVSPPPTPPPPTAADAVSLSSMVSYDHGVFTLIGTASSPADVRSVEISAVLNTGARQDLGAATLTGNDTFTFQDAIGANLQGFLVATETDDAGIQTQSADPLFSLTGGLGPRHGSGRQTTYAPGGGTEATVSLFRPGGQRSTTVEAPGQTVELPPSGIAFGHHQGGTTFVYTPGEEAGVVDVIHGFMSRGADHDTVSLSGADFHNSIADVLRHTGDIGGSAFITDPVTGDAIRLAGVSTAELSRKDFKFHP